MSGDDEGGYPPVWVHPSHRTPAVVIFLALLLAFVLILLFVGVAGFAFERIGFTPLEFAVILVATLVGSGVDIPLYQVKTSVPIVVVEEVRAFWTTYRIPRRAIRQVTTTIAINFGGAVVPILVSAYLLATHTSMVGYALIATLVTSVLVHLVARRVNGVGIVTPAFLPPLFAAVTAFLLVPKNPAIVAYVCGTLGTLIGADLSNLNKADTSGAQMESIGGAGTFDGVFLTGLIAVVLAAII